MKISVHGLGYVGCITAACLAEKFEVIGVDINPKKINEINSGIPTIEELGASELVKKAVQSGKLKATNNVIDAVKNTDVSIICVGTPSKFNGELDLTYIKRVITAIGLALAETKHYHNIVIRSSILPETIENKIIPLLEEASGKKFPDDFGICYNPEFLREGSAISDFNNPEPIIVGVQDKKSEYAIRELYKILFQNTNPIITDFKTAEIIKYVFNSWHAIKVAFANEIGAICKAQNIDARKVMDIFVQDKKLNLSAYYLKPGAPFGGSCLTKDTKAVKYMARTKGLDCPVIESSLISNEKRMSDIINLIELQNKKTITFFGLAFKAHTDDLRGSPVVEIIRNLNLGYAIKIFDPHINPKTIFGANKEYIETKLPNLSVLLITDINDAIKSSDILVVTNNSPEFKDIPKYMEDRHILIDLTGTVDQKLISKGKYVGLWW